MRLRAAVALLSRELFGIDLALPEFPEMKGIRGIGMSDPPELASRLALKFDYTNTFYHQAPFFDVTSHDPRDEGRIDFILSSEVMEHIPPPVDRGFDALCKLLKPDGLLLLTVPYNLGGKTREHFPDLHECALAAPGGRTVLVNRRRDGTLEVFDNLQFHGGHGSTLEIRVFTEESLRELLIQSGFRELAISPVDTPEFGIELAQPWSLPIAARKGRFVPPPVELASQYREAYRRAQRKEYDLKVLQADYERFMEFHNTAHEAMKRDLAERTEWAQTMEKNFEDRTSWALSLDAEKTEARTGEEQALVAAEALRKELDEARAVRAHLERRLWTRIGRKFGAL
jgi:SAM-dependent methyltransferase